MKRIGIIDFDTSHVMAFTTRLNHVDVKEDQFVDGGKVVVGCPGYSVIYPEKPAEEAAKFKKLGVPLVETPAEMLKYNLDAVFIEANSGFQHLERAKFFLEQKIPVYVDKPFACTVADAEEMLSLAAKANAPIFSSSSLRFAPEIVEAAGKPETKKPGFGMLAYAPAPTHEKNPGLFHYGIHGVEMLYTLMGPGCQWVVNTSTEACDVVTGVWSDGRTATLRAQRPSSGYGFVTFPAGKSEIKPVSTTYIYRELLKAIMKMLETGKAPVEPSTMLEIVRFIVKAADSAANHGMPQKLT